MSSKQKRYITIMDPVVVMQIDGVTPSRDETGQTYEEDHAIFIRNRTTDNAFVSDTPMDRNTVHWSMPMIAAANDIRTAVRGLKPGDVLELTEDEWELLKRATEKGTYGHGAASCLGFMRAITGATMEDPRKTKKKDAPRSEETDADAEEPAK